MRTPAANVDKRPAQRVSWCPDEDAALMELINVHGPRNWSVIAEGMTERNWSRVGKQCRERWRNHLNPSIRREQFTQEEDEMVLSLVEEIGTKWSKIAERMTGRTENMVKNRYYCSLRVRDVNAPKRAPRPKQRGGSGYWGNYESVDHFASWLTETAEGEAEEMELEDELAPEKLGNLMVNGLNEDERKRAHEMIDDIFTLIPPNFISPRVLEHMGSSRAQILEAAVAYIETAHDRLRKLGGSEDLLPPEAPRSLACLHGMEQAQHHHPHHHHPHHHPHHHEHVVASHATSQQQQTQQQPLPPTPAPPPAHPVNQQQLFWKPEHHQNVMEQVLQQHVDPVAVAAVVNMTKIEEEEENGESKATGEEGDIGDKSSISAVAAALAASYTEQPQTLTTMPI